MPKKRERSVSLNLLRRPKIVHKRKLVLLVDRMMIPRRDHMMKRERTSSPRVQILNLKNHTRQRTNQTKLMLRQRARKLVQFP